MESTLPRPEDHCRVQILIKPVGQFPAAIYERLLKKLEQKLNRVEVLTSQNVRRVLLLKFISEPIPELTRFAEFQAFRKIFGLICIGQYNGSQFNASSSSPDLSPPTEQNAQSRLRRSSLAKMPSIDVEMDEDEICLESKQMNILKKEYQKMKQQFNDQLVDSRCILFGFNTSQNSTEILPFPRFDDISFLFEQIETISRELLRSIYAVLDSKRLDTSFERMEQPPCLILPDEEKYRMGVENVKSKNYRKKCIGRLRKRMADYALLTGYFELAMQSYQSAIDLFKSSSDLLWLAAALEGYCCSAMMLKYGKNLTQTQRLSDNNANISLIQRATINSSNANGETKNSGHHRYRSDEAAKIIGSDFNLMPNPQKDENDSLLPSKNEQIENNSPINNNQLGEMPEQKRKNWRQLLNFDNNSSAQQNDAKRMQQIMKVHYENLPVPSGGMSSASRSASAQNLVNLNNSNSPTTNIRTTTANAIGSPNGSLKTATATNASKTISKVELADRFRQSLENYGRFSFAVNVEYECMMRAVHLHIVTSQFIEVESFLREHTCRFLDDKFTVFNNIMKSNICLATAEVYNQIGFKRKFAFFLRLAVFFRLYTDNHLDNDYKKVYPYLNESLTGYGIAWKLLAKNNKNTGKSLKAQFLTKIGASNTFSLQIKAVHEVFTVAMRSGLYEIATRHLCFMLEAFFDHLDKAASLALVEELNKLNQQNLDKFHELDKPISMDSSPPVFLPPLQFTRFPTLKDIQLLPHQAHLAPTIIETSSLHTKIFIYSPFQNRFKDKKEVHWVVNCATGVSIRAENPLPIELVVNNLVLLTEGCEFEAIPIRLNLPYCYEPCVDPTKNIIKLLGVPRSVGTLKIIGYSCEVLGCKNVCKFPTQNEPKQYTVRVLPHLPLLHVETSLKRVPTLSENPNEAIAEVCVFSGQSFIHTITLYNSSELIGIKNITVKIQQSKVAAGPKLLKIVSENPTNVEEFDYQICDLGPGERRKMDILIFGIDPTTATPSEKSSIEQKENKSGGEEQKVYVRRPTSMSLMTTDSGLPETFTAGLSTREESSKSEEISTKIGSAKQNFVEHSASTPLLEQSVEDEVDSSSIHDLIPYTGRLLSAEFAFTYIADLKPEKEGEEYMRFSKLPMAITIVPAVSVSNWHILAGDSPFSRYIVIDVLNQIDSEAELSYGQEQRKITVQPKEMCRVPLLCSCCTKIKSIAFQRVTQRASHMMQMQEIERLRRTIEKHVVKHLEIHWTIYQLNLNGQVPMGSLLSSVSFLRQLVLPSLTITMNVDQKSNNLTAADGGDINVRIGELLNIEVLLYYSISGTLTGDLSLDCYQDLQNNRPPIECSNNLLILGQNSMSFSIDGIKELAFYDGENDNEENDEEEEVEICSMDEKKTGHQYKAKFSIAFCYEGIYKINPRIMNLRVNGADEFFQGQQITTLTKEDIFKPALSFNVINKL